MSLYEDIHQTDNCDEEYLTKVVINPMSRTFNLYGSFGSHKTIECDIDEFASILEMTRIAIDEEDDCDVVYVNPL